MQSVTLTNMLTNGSFETDTTGWAGSGTMTRLAIPTPGHGEFGSWCGQDAQTVNGAHYLQRSAALAGFVSGHQYYIRSMVRYSTSGYGNIVQYYNAATALANGVAAFTMSAVNTWYLYDCVWTAPNSNSLQLRFNFSNGNGNQARTAQVDNVMIIDLTAAFGAGHEPATVTMAAVLPDGYFDGTKVVEV